MKSLEQTMLAEDPKKPRRIIDYLHSAFMIVVTSPVRCISKDSKSLLKVRRKPEQDRKATIFNKSARRGSTNKFRLRASSEISLFKVESSLSRMLRQEIRKTKKLCCHYRSISNSSENISRGQAFHCVHNF